MGRCETSVLLYEGAETSMNMFCMPGKLSYLEIQQHVFTKGSTHEHCQIWEIGTRKCTMQFIVKSVWKVTSTIEKVASRDLHFTPVQLTS